MGAALRKFIAWVGLEYKDPLEEQEYQEIKTPLAKDFFKYLVIILTAIMIAYFIRYLILDIYPQDYIILGLASLGVLIFLAQIKLQKYLEYVLLVYLILIVCVFATVFRELLKNVGSHEAFYMGYAFAMIHRLVGYRVIKSRSMIILYIVSLSVSLSVIPEPEPVLYVIIIVLDVVTIFLSFKSEKDERSIFDSLYKSRKDIFKFKQLLTQYLPNQMAIFATDYSQACYVNNSFKRTFKCHNLSQVKPAMERLVIERDTIEKFKTLFANLRIQITDDMESLPLSTFLTSLGQNSDMLRDIGTISFPIVEERTEEPVLDGNQQQQLQQQREENPLIDGNESHRSSDRGSSSKSVSSDLVIEEGRNRVYKMKLFPLFWDDAEALAMVLDDITQQRIIMELRVADKNKDLVIAMVSHELRTPLNAMLGFIDIAKKDIKDKGALSYLKACRNSGVLMLNLVNSILDLNQIKDKKLRLIFSVVTIPSLLEEVKGLFEYYCIMKKLYLNIEISDNTPLAIITDKSRLTQILVNLLGNAFKFTFKGGITVKAEPANSLDRIDKIRFSVQDTGIGISPENQEKLFKMYGRVEQTDKKVNTSGIGLGLTISNTLAILLNPLEGKGIDVTSEVDKGSCFSFDVQSQDVEVTNITESLAEFSESKIQEDKDHSILEKMAVYAKANNENYDKMSLVNYNIDRKRIESPPVSPPVERKIMDFKSFKDGTTAQTIELEASSRPVLKESPNNLKEVSPKGENKMQSIEEENKIEMNKSSPGKKPWCLVVDDNPFNLMVACHIMEERGYTCKTALNGQDGINKVKEQQDEGNYFKVILMDCQMPVMDGYEATRRINAMMGAGEVRECPIVALTANPRDDEHEKLCKEVGMSGHLGKPLQVEELENMLKKVQKGKRMMI